MNNCASFFAGVVLVKGAMLDEALASLDDCNNNDELTTDQSQKRAFLLQVSASLKREGLTDYYCSLSCKNVVKSLRCKCRYKKIDRQARQARQLALAQATLRLRPSLPEGARSAWRTSTMRRRSHAAISSTPPACRSSQQRRRADGRAAVAPPCYARSAGRSRTSSKLLNRRNIPNF